MSRPLLVIGNKNYSSWSMRPWLVAKHLGLEFEELRVPLYTGDYKRRLLEHSPAGKVPIWRDGDITVWESLAICEHLAESHPLLWPADAGARAWARSISAEMHAGFADLRREMPMNCRARGRRVELSADARRDVERMTRIWNECRDAFSSAGPWLFGDFGIADAMFAPVVSRFVTYGIEPPGAALDYIGTVMRSAPVRAWYESAVAESEMVEGFEVGVA